MATTSKVLWHYIEVTRRQSQAAVWETILISVVLTLALYGFGKFIADYLACIEYRRLRVELNGFCDASALQADFKRERRHGGVC